MATQDTEWTTYDGKRFPTEAAADTHETAVDAVVTQWVADNLGDYVAEGDRLAAGKVILTQSSTLAQLVRRTV
jgi:hypothetical protein